MSEIDLQKLDVAIEYVKRIADGKNPVTNQECPDDSVINNPNVIRCMFFIRDVLQQVKNHKGIIGGRSSGSKISFPMEVLSSFEYQSDLSITHFLNQLKNLCEDPKIVKLTTKAFTDWLKQNGYLEEQLDKFTGEKKILVTQQGLDFGLYMEERTSSYGRPYTVIMYGRSAQEYLVSHFTEIVSD